MPHLHIYRLKTGYAAVQSITEHFAIKVATMNHFCNKWMLPCAYHKINTFLVSKDEWDTKEGRGKSMKNALHVKL